MENLQEIRGKNRTSSAFQKIDLTFLSLTHQIFDATKMPWRPLIYLESFFSFERGFKTCIVYLRTSGCLRCLDGVHDAKLIFGCKLLCHE